MGGALSRVVFQPPRYAPGDGGPQDREGLISLTTRRGETIHGIHIKG